MLFLTICLIGYFSYSQPIVFEYDKVPANSGFKMEGYWIWCGSMIKVGDKYVLFYIGSDFTTYHGNSKSLLRRIGYAESSSITGPWTRSDQPLIATESNNPAILADGRKVKMVFLDEQLKVILAEAPNYKGPFKVVNDNLWLEAKSEDFYPFHYQRHTHVICEDNVGGVSGHERWGVHLFSVNGITDWKKYNSVVVYNHTITFENDTVLHCLRRERPQLLIENNAITWLITAVYDGQNSWSQPVKLKKNINY